MSIQRHLKFLKLGWMPLFFVACSGNTSVGQESSPARSTPPAPLRARTSLTTARRSPCSRRQNFGIR